MYLVAYREIKANMENSKAVSAAINVQLSWPEMSTPQ